MSFRFPATGTPFKNFPALFLSSSTKQTTQPLTRELVVISFRITEPEVPAPTIMIRFAAFLLWFPNKESTTR